MVVVVVEGGGAEEYVFEPPTTTVVGKIHNTVKSKVDSRRITNEDDIMVENPLALTMVKKGRKAIFYLCILYKRIISILTIK